MGAVIKVVGLGGAGGNAINRMVEAGVRGVELIAANTDNQVLSRTRGDVRIQLGETVTRGRGVGMDPAKGRLAAEESKEALREVMRGADMIFITTGMGGGTGTGAAPLAAQIARECSALTVGVVSRPFSFEGHARAQIADAGIKELRECVDSLLVIPNDRLLETSDESTPHAEAYRRADDVLRQSVQAISDVITHSGDINMDMADIKAIMTNAGEALMGVGEASGPHRAEIAAKAAIESPLLENVTIDGAKGLIVNIVGRSSDHVTMHEVNEVMALIGPAMSREAKMKIGLASDPSLGDRLRVTVIATGFPASRARGARPISRLVRGPAVTPISGPVQPERAFNPLDRGRRDGGQDLSKPAYLRVKVRKLR
ncbi:MAG: cell division protein FtsZ [Elusimicrobia bacterium CG_4_9_14_3_um_filter_62_55]|nr:MAG: cell division protein FtsZ [Elusimicrobia bacterium CG22_combo_CG10-13_8_21_14_all_63_91]PJA15645.1 MAG: cell division protein FtsZ [Elusimicrobia bacterium CG_4_10_14_0_2_um_filter_63_34]PJB23717.1 MAG: cell division protein FtsZ [Elusimicrobia bacterium CG_4_9_14_3_um_filter_62_55]